jgi:hypothetical protein
MASDVCLRLQRKIRSVCHVMHGHALSATLLMSQSPTVVALCGPQERFPSISRDPSVQPLRLSVSIPADILG